MQPTQTTAVRLESKPSKGKLLEGEDLERILLERKAILDIPLYCKQVSQLVSQALAQKKASATWEAPAAFPCKAQQAFRMALKERGFCVRVHADKDSGVIAFHIRWGIQPAKT